MKFLLITVIIWTIIGCKTSEQKESNAITENKETLLPNNWKFITECGLQFYIPSSLKEEKVQPIDSCVKQYGNENIRLTLDVIEGQPNTDFSRSKEYLKQSNFRLEKAIVAEKQAEIITFSDAGLHLNAKGFNYGAVLDVPHMNLTI